MLAKEAAQHLLHRAVCTLGLAVRLQVEGSRKPCTCTKSLPQLTPKSAGEAGVPVVKYRCWYTETLHHMLKKQVSHSSRSERLVTHHTRYQHCVLGQLLHTCKDTIVAMCRGRKLGDKVHGPNQKPSLGDLNRLQQPRSHSSAVLALLTHLTRADQAADVPYKRRPPNTLLQQRCGTTNPQVRCPMNVVQQQLA